MNPVDFTTLGYDPATSIGSQSISSTDEIQTFADIVSGMGVGGVTNQNLGANSVSDQNIQSLSWTKGQGGTLTLGGQNSISGIMQLEDSNGNPIMQADNEGLHFYDTTTNHNKVVTLDDTGLYTYDTSGNTLSKFTNQNAVFYGSDAIFFNPLGSGTPSGAIGVAGGNLVIGGINGNGLSLTGSDAVLQAQSGDLNLSLGNPSGSSLKIVTRKFAIGSDTAIIDQGGGVAGIVCGSGIKSAVVPTTKGYRTLYCMEMPEVWFADFAKIIRPPFWKFWKKPTVIVDPMFLEVTSLPYITMPTMDKTIVQIWGKRKGNEKLRFEEKTKEEFEKNNNFWNTPRI